MEENPYEAPATPVDIERRSRISVRRWSWASIALSAVSIAGTVAARYLAVFSMTVVAAGGSIPQLYVMAADYLDAAAQLLAFFALGAALPAVRDTRFFRIMTITAALAAILLSFLLV